MTTEPKGWSCPKCMRVWGPHVAACGPCNSGIASWGPNLVPPYRFTAGARVPTNPGEHIAWNYTGDDQSFASG